MWTPDAVLELITKSIIAFYTATFVYNILMGFAAAMLSNRDE